MRTLGFGSLVLGTALALLFSCGRSEGGGAGAGATAVTSSGGSGGAGAGGIATGGRADTQAGAGNEAGVGAALLDCDPKKILCKRLAPECGVGEVPSVESSCYGECVKVERCGCSAGVECPQPEQYTCMVEHHCGPFLK